MLGIKYSPDKITEILNEKVLPSLFPGVQVLGVRQERCIYREDRPLSILYSLDATGRENSAFLPSKVLVSLFEENTIKQTGIQDGIGSFGQQDKLPVIYLEEFQTLFEFFPMDWNLPNLRMVTDMDHMEPLLDQISAGASAKPIGMKWTYDVLRYHPTFRCVLLYYRNSDSSHNKLVGKLSCGSSRAANAWEALSTIERSCKDSPSQLAPSPLAFLDHLNLILMSHVPGLPLNELLRSKSHRDLLPRFVRLAATALAELHKVEYSKCSLPACPNHADRVLRDVRHIDGIDDKITKRMASLLDEIGRMSETTIQNPRLIHGSFHTDQLLISEGQAHIVDFEESCIGDPAIDIGTFLASLSTFGIRRGNPKYLASLSEHFFSEYLNSSSDNGLVPRSLIVKCKKLVERAARSMRRRAIKYPADYQIDVPLMYLMEAEACLVSA